MGGDNEKIDFLWNLKFILMEMKVSPVAQW